MSGAQRAAELETTGNLPGGPSAYPTGVRRGWRPWWTGLAGFMLGALFWHLVGFWSFVSEVAFNSDEVKSPSRLINLDAARSVGASRQAASTAQSLSNAATLNEASAEPSEENSNSDMLSELLQCSEARRAPDDGDTDVLACPPLRRRLPTGRVAAARADRQMDAREAAERLANGWETGVSRIETGSVR